MRVVLSASQGNVGSVVSSVSGIIKREFGGKSSGVGSSAGALGGVFAGLGVDLVGLGIKSAQMAGDFQAAMDSNVARAGLVKSQVDNVSTSLMQMGPAVGEGPTQLATALYPVLSGLSSMTDQTAKSQVALVELKNAAESVAGTTANLDDVSKAQVGTLNAYGLSTNNVALATQRLNMISDVMNGTVRDGNMQWAEYSRMIGNYMAKSSGAGVKIQEANAALAVFTNMAVSPQLAGTHLGALFQTLGGDADTLAKRAAKMGGTMKYTSTFVEVVGTHFKTLHKTITEHVGPSFDVTKFKAMDLADKVKYLDKITGDDPGKLKAILGNKTLVQTFLDLHKHMGDYQNSLSDLNHSQGATNQAFGDVNGGFNFKLKQAQASLQELGIKVGNALLPAFSNLVDFVRNPLMPWLDNLIVGAQNIAKWFGSAGPQGDILKNALIGIGLAIGTVKMADLVGNIIGMTRSSLDFVTNVGPRVVGMLSGGSGIAGASKTMATDVEANSVAAKTAVSGIGDAATVVIGILAGIPLALNAGQAWGNWTLNNVFNQATGTHDTSNGSNTANIAPGFPRGPGTYDPATAQPSLFQKFALWLATHGASGFAVGGRNIPGGSYLVGELGPEIMDVPGGSNIRTASQTRSALSGHGRGGHVTNNFSISIVSQATMTSQLVDELEQEIAFRFRQQTGGFSEGGYR